MQKSLNIPIYKALKSYIEEKPTPFHMPGHKMGKGIPEDWSKFMGKMDLTEIGGLDNLHFPTGVIKEAQELAASAFGALETYFLVNGSSVGIHASIMTVCNPGDKIIVSRDCHRSVIGGVFLAGAHPVYVPVKVDENYKMPTFLNTKVLAEALEANPDARAVLITRPNYYGICSDIKKIAEITHSYGKVLIVDEAHGAHYKFHSSLPETALSGGADICIQSAHKTLPALTQGAYLHLNSNFLDSIDIDRLEFNLRLLQTTSPSYLLMSSLDLARALMEQYGEQLLENLMKNIDWLEKYVSELNGIMMFGEKDLATENPDGGQSIEFDKTRVVINLGGLGKTGYWAENELRKKFHVQVEMSDLFNIVCIATVADEKKDFEKLIDALRILSREQSDSYHEINKRDNLSMGSLDLPEQVMNPHRVFSSKSRHVQLKTSAGRISRDFIVPYPPGVPLLCPGEIINQDIIEYIYRVIDAGGVVNGILEDNGLKISVVE